MAIASPVGCSNRFSCSFLASFNSTFLILIMRDVYALNNGVRLTTRVYGTDEELFLKFAVPCRSQNSLEDNNWSSPTFRNSSPDVNFWWVLVLRFSFLGCFTFLKHSRPWWSTWTEHSSLQITFSKLSFSSIPSWHHTRRFCLLTTQTSWQYFGRVWIQPNHTCMHV